ncbi:heme-degrading domain-containing protein [Petropleomorpha daqingensis]|uniref:UPF0303 protein GGQ55_004629 n=1 Tax=Petropleomorpha daqingensis TaxID=2026353 RepID=A0A853CME4_9ACTN|nr:heme-degrading domain-containing protein [Petropleomorpha daqingensis]NYJ08351.1 uncharacterized protein (UPF0303 family) [Petropleomorpha daqingensis]
MDFPTVAELAAEEQELQFRSFTNDDALALGSALVAAARERGAPVIVDITRNGHQLFRAALTGSAPDNDTWIARKQRVVHRFGHSSLHVRQASIERGTTFEEEFALDPERYAAHGGAVPVLVRDVGPIGVVTVSGLPQVEDHRMVVAAIRAHLAR